MARQKNTKKSFMRYTISREHKSVIENLLHDDEGVVENQIVALQHNEKLKQSLYLLLYELSLIKKNEYIGQINDIVPDSAGMDIKLQTFLGISVHEMNLFKNDNTFKQQLGVIKRAEQERILSSLNAELAKKLATGDESKEITMAIANISKVYEKEMDNFLENSNTIPVKEWSSFFHSSVLNNIKVLARAIEVTINDYLIPKVVETLDNKMMTDDGTAWVVNPDYERPHIKIMLDGEDITNKVEISGVQDLLRIARAQLIPYLNTVIINQIANGEYSKYAQSYFKK